MIDPITHVIIAATFLLAGTVKGVLGLGLPTVSLALLTVATDLPTAMVLLLVPSLVTNLWQAFIGGEFVALVTRLWAFLLVATVMIWVGGMLFVHVELGYLSSLLGLLLMIYASISLAGYRFRITPQYESWAGPLVGVLNGFFTGLTGSFVVPGVMYLQSIGLTRSQLIQSMGILFTVSTLALGFTLHGNSLLPSELGIASSMGLVPAIVGMIVGRRIRNRMSEATFRRIFFGALFILGAYITMISL